MNITLLWVVYSMCILCSVKGGVPPTDAPVITINDDVITTGQTYEASLGQTLDIECTVLAGWLIVNTVTISCGTLVHLVEVASPGTDITTVSRSFPMLEAFQGLVCTCSALLPTYDYDLETSFTFSIAEEPPILTPALTANQEPLEDGIDFHIGFLETLNVACSISGGYPDVSNVTIACTGMDDVTETGTSASRSFQATAERHQTECVCSADHVTDDYHKTTRFIVVIIPEPPSNPPIVTANQQPISDGTEFNIAYRQTLEVGCSVDGGFPEVDNVTISCTGMEETSMDGTSATKSFDVTADEDMTTCVCSARHMTEMYLLNTTFTVAIIPEPPNSPPRVTANGNSVLNGSDYNITVGHTFDILCDVDGGYPDVDNVTISCSGLDDVTIDGKSASTTFEITEDLDQGQCVCSAQHLTGRYIQSISFEISAFDPVTLTSFSIGSKSDTSSVNEITYGDNVISCQARGIPAPTVSIKAVPSGVPLEGVLTTSPTDRYTRRFELTKDVTCKDLGAYKCVADNAAVSERDLDVIVLCPPNVHDYASSAFLLQVNRMRQLYIGISVESNPAVNSFKLAKYQRQEDDPAKLSLVKEFEPFEYDVEKIYTNLRNDLDLTFFDLDPNTDCLYTLTVINGVDPPLQVSFNASSFVRDISDAESSGGGNKQVVSLSLVAAMSCLCVCCVVIGAVVYIKMYVKESSVAKTKGKRPRRHRLQNVDNGVCGQSVLIKLNPFTAKKISNNLFSLSTSLKTPFNYRHIRFYRTDTCQTPGIPAFGMYHFDEI